MTHRGSGWPEDDAPPSIVFGTEAALPSQPVESEPPASSRFDGEDFLFHLYRGSELLQDNCVEEAKEELERALSVRPRDIEGQGLLGVVYFRLGMYPRAIHIYREIVRERPEEVTPRLNLALCYFKTGQPGEARAALEAVIERQPDHRRAWGYLGLVFERLYDYEKAEAAFERAGQAHLARRMRARLEEGEEHPSEPSPPNQEEMRRAAADAVSDLDSGKNEPPFSRAEEAEEIGPPSGRWRAREPGEERVPRRRSQRPPRPSSPPPPPEPIPESLSPLSLTTQLATGPVPPDALVEGRILEAPRGRAEKTPQGLVAVNVTEGLATQSRCVRAIAHRGEGLKPEPLRRRLRGRHAAEPFGGESSGWVLLEGAGVVLLEPAPGLQLFVVDLGGEFVYLRESRLVAFEGLVSYENGRLPTGEGGPVPMVQLAGEGVVVFQAHPGLRSLPVTADQTVAARIGSVLGWTGRLLGQPGSLGLSGAEPQGLVTFSGDGAVLLDDP